MFLRKGKGQSTLEYVIVLAVVAAVVVGAGVAFKDQIAAVYNSVYAPK